MIGHADGSHGKCCKDRVQLLPRDLSYLFQTSS